MARRSEYRKITDIRTFCSDLYKINIADYRVNFLDIIETYFFMNPLQQLFGIGNNKA